ncbi:hypothetical protein JCM18750_35450 [Halostagnicola bangensis]
MERHRSHAVDNLIAQFQHEIAVNDVLVAPIISDPLGLYDACPVTDGASAIVLVSDAFAASHGCSAPTMITGTGQASDRLALQARDSLIETPATSAAASAAYRQAGIEPTDIDVAEVHDCFTIAEILAIEGLGFYDIGTGYRAARDGETWSNGSLPVNLSGGLKAKGHPVGATGVAQVVELTKLLNGRHVNANTVPDATTGLAHNAGGTVASATVTILEVVE